MKRKKQQKKGEKKPLAITKYETMMVQAWNSYDRWVMRLRAAGKIT